MAELCKKQIERLLFEGKCLFRPSLDAFLQKVTVDKSMLFPKKKAKVANQKLVTLSESKQVPCISNNVQAFEARQKILFPTKGCPYSDWGYLLTFVTVCPREVKADWICMLYTLSCFNSSFFFATLDRLLSQGVSWLLFLKERHAAYSGP